MARSEKSLWRVGNFVIRRREVPAYGEEDWSLSENQVSKRVRKGEMGTVPCLEASSLDGVWAVRFMPGSQIEALLLAALEGGGESPSMEWVELVLTNVMASSSIPNGHFQQALLLLLSAYFDPSLIDGGVFSGKTRRFLKEARAVRDNFLAWRKEYEGFLESIPDEEPRHVDSLAEAERILGE